MKNKISTVVVLLFCIIGTAAFSQTDKEKTKESGSLGLPGDNLDLYAVLDLFQKSKTIEDFEKSLNSEKAGINNLDLNLDKKVDFIKVVTKQKDNDFTFILQINVSEKETQDVAVILVSKDKNKKVTMQIVGDKDLYGKDYI
jgi:predicted ribonuclease YlaK